MADEKVKDRLSKRAGRTHQVHKTKGFTCSFIGEYTLMRFSFATPAPSSSSLVDSRMKTTYSLPWNTLEMARLTDIYL